MTFYKFVCLGGRSKNEINLVFLRACFDVLWLELQCKDRPGYIFCVSRRGNCVSKGTCSHVTNVSSYCNLISLLWSIESPQMLNKQSRKQWRLNFRFSSSFANIIAFCVFIAPIRFTWVICGFQNFLNSLSFLKHFSCITDTFFFYIFANKGKGKRGNILTTFRC